MDDLQLLTEAQQTSLDVEAATASLQRLDLILEHPEPHDRDEAILLALGHLEDATIRLDSAQVRLVRAARAAGATWEQIGGVLGVTGSAVRQRLGHTST